MILILSLVLLMGIYNVQTQPISCLEDKHCESGFFCHKMTNWCHECLSCEKFRRQPASEDYDCIKSAEQCGPCLNGFDDDIVHWGSTCLSRGIRTPIASTYIFVWTTCLAAGFLLSLVIIQVILNTHIIQINLAMPYCKINTLPPFGPPNDVAASVSVKENQITA